MSRMHRALIVLSIIGCVAFPFGSALKCYVCVPTAGETCAKVNETMLMECPAAPPNTETTTTEKPATKTTTTDATTTDTTTTDVTTTEATTTEATTTDATTTEATTTDATTTEATTTEATTTDATTTEATTTDTTTTEATTTKATTTEATTTKATTTEATTTKETTTKATTTEATTTKETTTEAISTKAISNEASFDAYHARQRNRRSLMDRLSPMHPFADETKVHCFTLTDGTNVTRGCSTQDNACSVGEKCKTCDSDNCNSNDYSSATSNIVFTSMIMSLVIALIIAK